jgi:hypothetical protein
LPPPPWLTGSYHLRLGAGAEGCHSFKPGARPRRLELVLKGFADRQSAPRLQAMAKPLARLLAPPAPGAPPPRALVFVQSRRQAWQTAAELIAQARAIIIAPLYMDNPYRVVLCFCLIPIPMRAARGGRRGRVVLLRPERRRAGGARAAALRRARPAGQLRRGPPVIIPPPFSFICTIPSSANT